MVPNIAPESLQALLVPIQEWCAHNVKARSLDEAEQLAQSLARCIAEVIAQAAVDNMDGTKRTGCSIPCACGHQAQYKGVRQRLVVTLAGSVRANRAYHCCKQCKTGVLPWDRRQGLDQRQCSPSLKALICELAASLTYTNAVTLLQRTCGIRVEESSAEQVVEQVGRRLRDTQAQTQKGIMAGSRYCQTRGEVSMPRPLMGLLRGANVQATRASCIKYHRLAGYPDAVDSDRLARDLTLRLVVSRRANDRQAAARNTVGRLEAADAHDWRQ